MFPFRFAMHGKRGLRMMVVSLLSSSPKNGVEIMDGVEAMTRGWWRPSPGSVYPLLERMSQEGTVKKREDGRYELTSKAHAELEVSFGSRFRGVRSPEDAVREMESILSYAEDIARSEPKSLEALKGRMRAVAKRLSDLSGP
jgi:DNA-binding PadR family transcriptional regulator